MGNSKIIYNDETLIDLTEDTVTADTLLLGATAHDASGEEVTGTVDALKNPYALTFIGAVEATYDGSEAVTIDVPSGGSGTSATGGYYKPVVTQPDADTMQVAYSRSSSDLPAVSAVNITLPQGPQGEKGDTGAAGSDGNDGADGVSPTVSVADISGGHKVTITDVSGTKTFDVMNGAAEVVEDISDAESDVAYVLGEEADGDISEILAGYERARDKLQIININTDDGTDGNVSSDSTLIKTPNCNILVDIGRKTDYDTVKDAILAAGVMRLDYIFLTHYHHDHCGCISSPSSTAATESSLYTFYESADIDTSNCVLVLPHTPIFEDLYEGEDSPTVVKNIYDIVQGVITEKNITFQILENSHEGCYWGVDAFVSGNVPEWTETKPKAKIIIKILNCSDEKFSNYYEASYDSSKELAAYNARTYNNYGTIIEIEYGYTLYTLAADINYTAEAANYAEMRQTDVLKMGHHSGNSEITQEFYEKLNPRFTVFSVDHDVFLQYASSIIAERPVIAWLAARKTPMYFLSESGTMVWQSDGTKYELLTNNRNQHPEGQGTTLLWSGSVSPGSTIDLSGTGWKDYTLYKVLLANNGTGIIATRVTTSGGEYFRGIGGSTNTSGTFYMIAAAFNATVSDDVITVMGTTNESHTTSSPYHSISSNPAVIAIYGIC